MKISLIAGARPNFMKIAPIIDAIKKAQLDGKNISYRLVHTGQHYDSKMSDSFFTDLNIPFPDINLACGSGTQTVQTASIMVAFEEELIANPADIVMVVGDVTSTLACSIVAKKNNTIVAHVEAGIRSGDMGMPEEVNRIVTDSISDLFFTTSTWANSNLLKSGVSKDKIFFVGNVMIDTLLANKSKFKEPFFWNDFKLKKDKYFVLTLHRPSNVDNLDKLQGVIYDIASNTNGFPIIFPMHPRTVKAYTELGVSHSNLFIVDPLGYHEFNYLVKNAVGVITDSGGITEETTVMGVPCLTLRDSTERPETVQIGTNELIGTNSDAIKMALRKLLSGNWKSGAIPELWDGKAAERIINIILSL